MSVLPFAQVLRSYFFFHLFGLHLSVVKVSRQSAKFAQYWMRCIGAMSINYYFAIAQRLLLLVRCTHQSMPFVMTLSAELRVPVPGNCRSYTTSDNGGTIPYPDQYTHCDGT